MNGQVQLVDNDTVKDGNDGTDTLVGIETVQFKDQAMGITSPIILDLDGNGVTTRTASESAARFDMDGDGKTDDTSWIGSTEAFLFLDRDGNGTLSGIGEMSFVGDHPGATTDLAGLRAFDSSQDGKLSSADIRFSDFRVWRDGNGNGAVDGGEILDLGAIGLTSLSLAGAVTNSEVATGGIAVVNTASWTRADGASFELADAAMTYFSAAFGHGVGLRHRRAHLLPNDRAEAASALDRVFDQLRGLNLVRSELQGNGNARFDALIERALQPSDAESAVTGAQHTQLYSRGPIAGDLDAHMERRLAAMTQDMAAFAGSTAAQLALRYPERTVPMDLFAA